MAHNLVLGIIEPLYYTFLIIIITISACSLDRICVYSFVNIFIVTENFRKENHSAGSPTERGRPDLWN